MPKPEKKRSTPEQANGSALASVIERLKKEHSLVEERKDNIVDIITFCEHPDLLNLPSNNLNLYLSQRVVLKAFYKGSKGNEDLRMTPEEIAWLSDKKQNNVLEKLHRMEQGEKIKFSELTLVLGRRSSKTVLASIICAYEVYKLLSVGEGDPYKYYGIPYDQEIAVINVATSRKQAGRLFSQIKARVRNSKFFRNRIHNVTSEEIRIYTDTDLQKLNDPNIKVPVDGSVVLVCGHSNPDSLRGYASICIIFDELAFYDEAEKVSGIAFYEALTPSVSDFKGDGIIVEISSPGPKTGIFYKLWEQSFKVDSMLSFQMATWLFNPDKSYDHPELVKFRSLDPAAFDVEFGAQWPEGGAYGLYFPENLVKQSIRVDGPELEPQQGGEYFFHIDPAITGDRYVMVAVRKETYRDYGGNLCPRSILAFCKLFSPDNRIGLDYEKIDEEVLELCRKYRPALVTYDQWNSIHSIQKLSRNGVNVLQTSFNRGYKNRIYQNLRDLMQKPECGLWLYDEPQLIMELLNLKYRPTPRGQSIGADTRGDCPTDDYADCLAGAAFMASGHYYKQLPQPILAWTGMR